jgi:hypothetical protein
MSEKPTINLDPTDEVKSAPVADETANAVIADALTRVAAPQNGNTEQPVEEVDTEAVTLSLPPTIEFMENVKDTFAGHAFEVKLYGEGCLECGHLVPSCEEKQTKCHFSNGNQFCPAASIRVAFVGQRMRYINRLKKAQAAKDANRVMKVLQDLENESIEDKTYVLEQVGLLIK